MCHQLNNIKGLNDLKKYWRDVDINTKLHQSNNQFSGSLISGVFDIRWGCTKSKSKLIKAKKICIFEKWYKDTAIIKSTWNGIIESNLQE